jgi:hypothetical protein
MPVSPTIRPPRLVLASTAAMRPVHTATLLPSISTLTGLRDGPEFQHSLSSQSVQLSHPSPTSYSPLSAEDRRVLNSFKVVL